MTQSNQLELLIIWITADSAPVLEIRRGFVTVWKCGRSPTSPDAVVREYHKTRKELRRENSVAQALPVPYRPDD
ncbi:Hypothetical protein NTJ_09755 [Nesidiocoris tenuis]|uniref:Uncharacterized protein n=1 Tax=Nesidiocoris tenuis TaxID=355587 RepID=A0ABN7AXQ5_9HEMI|nr:Hypothetical protein NTJ_09755 [Nesidiocoris tenuis]